jgi:hypothetical protein
MNLTLNLYTRKKKIKFFMSKPTTYFLKWYFRNFKTIVNVSSQKLPKINKNLLVTLL